MYCCGELNQTRRDKQTGLTWKLLTKGTNRGLIWIAFPSSSSSHLSKDHLSFRGHWKEKGHGRYTPTVITNEYNRLFCFEKLSHLTYAKDNAVKVTQGTFIWMNSGCLKAFKSFCKGKVSALAIGLAGVDQLLFGAAFACLTSKQTFNTYLDSAIKLSLFLIGNRSWARSL